MPVARRIVTEAAALLKYKLRIESDKKVHERKLTRSECVDWAVKAAFIKHGVASPTTYAIHEVKSTLGKRGGKKSKPAPKNPQSDMFKSRA